MEYWYNICGLTVKSTMSLRAFETDLRQADLYIDEGVVPKTIPNMLCSRKGWKMSLTEALLTVDGLAYYYIQDGKSITVEVLDDSYEDEYKRFLLIMVINVIMIHKKIFPYHGNGLRYKDTGILICGESGAGKSSLSMEMISHGAKMISDDYSRIDIEGDMMIYPYVSAMKVKPDIMEKYNIDEQKYDKVSQYFSKYYYNNPQDFTVEKTLLSHIFFIEVGEVEEVSIKKLGLTESLPALIQSNFSQYKVDLYNHQKEQFESAKAMIERVPIYKITRPEGMDSLSEQYKIINGVLEGDLF